MDLRCLHRDIPVFLDRILTCHVPLKGMTALMSDDIQIPARPVKVCKNKRRMVIRQIGHVAARTLCLAAKHIEQLIFQHKIKKFLRLLRHIPVHHLSGLQDLLR